MDQASQAGATVTDSEFVIEVAARLERIRRYPSTVEAELREIDTLRLRAIGEQLEPSEPPRSWMADWEPGDG